MNKLDWKEYKKDLRILALHRSPDDCDYLNLPAVITNAVPVLLSRLFGKLIKVRYDNNFNSDYTEYYKSYLFRGKLYDSGYSLSPADCQGEVLEDLDDGLERFTAMYYKGQLLMTNVPEDPEDYDMRFGRVNQTHGHDLQRQAGELEKGIELDGIKRPSYKVPVMAYVRAYFHDPKFRKKNIRFLKSFAAGEFRLADDSDNLYYCKFGVNLNTNIPFVGANWIPLPILGYLLHGTSRYSSWLQTHSLADAYVCRYDMDDLQNHEFAYSELTKAEDEETREKVLDWISDLSVLEYYPTLYGYNRGIKYILTKFKYRSTILDEGRNI